MTESSDASRRARFQERLKQLTGDGWIVTSQSEHGAQLRKPKRVNALGLLLFVGLPLLGIVLFNLSPYLLPVGALLVALDYVLRKEQTLFITAD